MYNHLSPSYKLYFSIQEKYPDHIICMEVGTFYEIHQYKHLGFSSLVSEELDIDLTSKNKSDPDHPLMCGFPVHTSAKFFRNLTRKGYSIVIVSQRDIEGQTQKERFVEKILSPSTYIENINQETSNYFSCIYIDEDVCGVSSVDITTGEVVVSEMETKHLNNYIDKLRPTEILLFGIHEFSKNFKTIHRKENAPVKKLNQCGKILSHVYEEDHISDNYKNIVSKIGLGMYRYGALSLSNLLNYFSDFEHSKNLLRKIDKPLIENFGGELQIPLNGIKSLELFESFEGNLEGSLLSVINYCQTAMGRRLLVQRLKNPFTSKEEILKRHDIVDKYIKENIVYEELKNVFDIEKISRKFVFKNITARQMANLIISFENIELILKKEESELISSNKKILKYLNEHIDKEKALISSYSNFDYFKGDLFEKIKKEYNEIINLKKDIEKEKNFYIDKAIENFKKPIKFSIEKNDQGYLIRCSKKYSQVKEVKEYIKSNKHSSLLMGTNLNKLLDNLFEKEIILESKARKALLAFQADFVEKFLKPIKDISKNIAEIDLLQNFAKISKERGYYRPIIKDKPCLNLKQVRHPVVEISKNLESNYVSNSVELNKKENILCLYGANSSGKSTLLKASALSVILNQMGCFIPASKGSELSIYEYILTRMTTFDSLSEGFSTFTMEMHELQESLRFMNKKSLFLLDEIGRGTSPEDGEAIAFAVLDYMSSKEFEGVGFFATHYHDLYPKIKNYKNIKIFHTYVEVRDKKLILFRDLRQGKGAGSYGIKVAESCGIPDTIIRSANNYSKNYAPIKTSRYNSNEFGIICEWCDIQPVEETHHLEPQLQGKKKQFEKEDGSILSINDKRNIIMVCSTCHNKMDSGEIDLVNKDDIKDK